MSEQISANFHYIADDSIGGIEREYFEDDKQAVAGDLIHRRFSGKYEVATAQMFLYGLGAHVVLSPTGRIRIDGVIYRKDSETYSDEASTDNEHIISLAQTVAELRRELDEANTHIDAVQEVAKDARYQAGQAELTSQQFTDRLTEVELKVHHAMLKARIADMGVDDLAKLNDGLQATVEMHTEDIAYLDERTQPLATDEGASEFAVDVGEIIGREIDRRLGRGKGRI